MDKLKILIAEDDVSVQKLYDKGLTDEIFNKRFTSDGAGTMEIYETWHPDIIILDIYMPTMTGYSVLKKIREGFEDTGTAIIMCTSLAEDDHIKDCMALGINGYIVKPFKFKTLGTEILKRCQSGDAKMKDVREVIKHIKG